MLKFTIVLCAVLFASVESCSKLNVNANSLDIVPDISEIEQKFQAANEKYQQIDDNNIFTTIASVMKEIRNELAKLDVDNKNFVTYNCIKYARHLFDTVNHILETNSQCHVNSLKARFHHIKSIYEHLNKDLDDFNTIRTDVMPCCDTTCANVARGENHDVKTMYDQIFPAKIIGLISLLTSFDKSVSYCAASEFPDFQEESSTVVANTRKCIKQ